MTTMSTSKKFANVKSIQFDLLLNGKGCVNFDSSEQLDFLTSVGIVSMVKNLFMVKREHCLISCFRKRISEQQKMVKQNTM